MSKYQFVEVHPALFVSFATAVSTLTHSFSIW